jgi:hypothetical protein
MVLGTSLPGENPRKFLFLKSNPLIDRMIAQISLKKIICPQILDIAIPWRPENITLRPENSRPTLPNSVVPEERRRPQSIPPPVMEMGPFAQNKLGWEEKWMDSRLLAKLRAYHRTGKNLDMFNYQQLEATGGEDKTILPWITFFFGFSERKAFDRHSSGGRVKSRIR